jgi:hypothetical protein
MGALDLGSPAAAPTAEVKEKLASAFQQREPSVSAAVPRPASPKAESPVATPEKQPAPAPSETAAVHVEIAAKPPSPKIETSALDDEAIEKEIPEAPHTPSSAEADGEGLPAPEYPETPQAEAVDPKSVLGFRSSPPALKPKDAGEKEVEGPSEIEEPEESEVEEEEEVEEVATTEEEEVTEEEEEEEEEEGEEEEEEEEEPLPTGPGRSLFDRLSPSPSASPPTEKEPEPFKSGEPSAQSTSMFGQTTTFSIKSAPPTFEKPTSPTPSPPSVKPVAQKSFFGYMSTAPRASSPLASMVTGPPSPPSPQEDEEPPLRPIAAKPSAPSSFRSFSAPAPLEKKSTTPPPPLPSTSQQPSFSFSLPSTEESPPKRPKSPFPFAAGPKATPPPPSPAAQRDAISLREASAPRITLKDSPEIRPQEAGISGQFTKTYQLMESELELVRFACLT